MFKKNLNDFCMRNAYSSSYVTRALDIEKPTEFVSSVSLTNKKSGETLIFHSQGCHSSKKKAENCAAEVACISLCPITEHNTVQGEAIFSESTEAAITKFLSTISGFSVPIEALLLFTSIQSSINRMNTENRKDCLKTYACLNKAIETENKVPNFNMSIILKNGRKCIKRSNPINNDDSTEDSKSRGEYPETNPPFKLVVIPANEGGKVIEIDEEVNIYQSSCGGKSIIVELFDILGKYVDDSMGITMTTPMYLPQEEIKRSGHKPRLFVSIKHNPLDYSEGVSDSQGNDSCVRDSNNETIASHDLPEGSQSRDIAAGDHRPCKNIIASWLATRTIYGDCALLCIGYDSFGIADIQTLRSLLWTSMPIGVMTASAPQKPTQDPSKSQNEGNSTGEAEKPVTPVTEEHKVGCSTDVDDCPTTEGYGVLKAPTVALREFLSKRALEQVYQIEQISETSTLNTDTPSQEEESILGNGWWRSGFIASSSHQQAKSAGLTREHRRVKITLPVSIALLECSGLAFEATSQTGAETAADLEQLACLLALRRLQESSLAALEGSGALDILADMLRSYPQETFFESNRFIPVRKAGGQGLFSPSLALQRRSVVVACLRASGAQSWLDIGCGNCKMMIGCITEGAKGSSSISSDPIPQGDINDSNGSCCRMPSTTVSHDVDSGDMHVAKTLRIDPDVRDNNDGIAEERNNGLISRTEPTWRVRRVCGVEINHLRLREARKLFRSIVPDRSNHEYWLEADRSVQLASVDDGNCGRDVGGEGELGEESDKVEEEGAKEVSNPSTPGQICEGGEMLSTVELWHGSILHSSSSQQLLTHLTSNKAMEGRHWEVVSVIEVIEHLPSIEAAEKVLQFIITKLQPDAIIISTPNYEANSTIRHSASCLSRGMPLEARSSKSKIEESDSKSEPFREFDHKFEFTRQEFRDWAHNSNRRCGEKYDISICEIGTTLPGMRGTDGCGGATQFAIFRRKDILHENSRADVIDPKDGSTGFELYWGWNN